MAEETTTNKKAYLCRRKNRTLAFLDAILKGNGLTYLDLANMLGISQTAFADMMRKDDIKTTYLALISEKLGYSLQFGFIPKGATTYEKKKGYDVGDSPPLLAKDKTLIPIEMVMRAKSISVLDLARLLHVDRKRIYYRFSNGMMLTDLMELVQVLGGSLAIEMKRTDRVPTAWIEI